MNKTARDLARRLADDAEGVCRAYLSNGRRQGRYWLVGDVDNSPGRSLFVRLAGPDFGKGARGKWTDASTGQHGDLLDLVRLRSGATSFRVLADEARRFLRVPRPPYGRDHRPASSTAGAARRLFNLSRPISDTPAETYLDARGLQGLRGLQALRFHPRCFYRGAKHERLKAWPAMIAGVTSNDGVVTGVHRTWLTPSGEKAPVCTPRRALGDLVNHAVRFGRAEDIIAVGEGVETVLSLRAAFPALPTAAALSSAHLPAFVLPPTVSRLYIVADRDSAGGSAAEALRGRAEASGVEAIVLRPRLGDFNDDLRRWGRLNILRHAGSQMAPRDAERFGNCIS